jgi:hypothetical protein
MVVFQFEGFLPGTNEIYRYDFTGARKIGGHLWRMNAGAYSAAAMRRSNPGNEATAMHEALTALGYDVPDVQVMFRLVTLGNAERKHELILFYLEGTDDPKWLTKREDAPTDWQERATEMERRALASFQVVVDAVRGVR